MKLRIKSITVLLLLALVVSFILAGCKATNNEGASNEQMDITIEELAKYNGMDGNPAYIAVDGIIYDVTEVKEWRGGQHNGFEAGRDLTEEIKNMSPHGVSKLTKLKKIGRLLE